MTGRASPVTDRARLVTDMVRPVTDMVKPVTDRAESVLVFLVNGSRGTMPGIYLVELSKLASKTTFQHSLEY